MNTYDHLIFHKLLYSFLCLWTISQHVSGDVKLGGMESWGFNGVRTGMVSLVSPYKLKIRGLDYTGEGPAVWFMVGKEDDPYNEEFAELTGTIIPDEHGSCTRLLRYRNENIMLTLPKGMNFTNYDYLAMYCTRFNHNFGYVKIKRDASPSLMEPMDPQEKRPKACPQDHLEDDDDDDGGGGGEEEEEEEEDDNRRKKRKNSISNLRKKKKSTVKIP